MPMYNLFEYGHNYCVRSGGLWNCYRDIIGETPEKTSQSRNPADADQAA